MKAGGHPLHQSPLKTAFANLDEYHCTRRKKPNVPEVVYPESVELAASRLKVLSHPQRIAIVDLLGRKGPMSVTAIFSELKMPQAITSAHLINMKDRGILASKKTGTTIHYSLRVPAMINVIECLREHMVKE